MTGSESSNSKDRVWLSGRFRESKRQRLLSGDEFEEWTVPSVPSKDVALLTACGSNRLKADPKGMAPCWARADPIRLLEKSKV
jgi:hypothetical protein